MDRIFEYFIEKSESLIISEYLRRLGYSAHLVTRLKHTDGTVQVNGENAPVNHILVSGETLRIFIPEEKMTSIIPATPLPLHIIYEDEDIIVIDKPSKMPIHPSQRHHEDTLANALMHYFAGQNFIFRCLTRLDKDTSGLVLVAKNLLASSILSENMKSGDFIKKYTAICENTDNNLFDESNMQGTIEARISRREGSTIERIISNDGQEAITHYKVLEIKKEHALVQLYLETGRTHQIRVHMKHIGHPLVGDYIYNPANNELDRQALHCSNLSFTHPINGKFMTFESELPSDMYDLFYNEVI